jgi:putative ABC transport system permease protein
MEYGSTTETIQIMNQDARPPLWIFRILAWFCPSHLFEEIEGDLLERYDKHLRSAGPRKAKWRLIWSVIRFFRPGILFRNKLSTDMNSLYMLSNYLKISLRVIVRNKTFSFINISGLVLGMTGALLLFLWIVHETTFDQFHTDKERLYVAWNNATENGQVNSSYTTPRILAPTIEKDFTAVENAISYAEWESTHLFMVGDTKLLKTSGVFADKEVLNVLSFPLAKGNPASVFDNPSSVVLTEKFAHELFGDKEAFGETLTIAQSGYKFEFVVSGILKDLPPNTEYKFDYLIPFTFLESLGEKDTFWGNNSVKTIVKLKEGTDISLFNLQIKDLVKKNYANGSHIELFLYPLTEMRLYSRFENGVPAGGRIEVMRLLGLLGIFLIVIACINFVNLYTARAQRRSKEIAVRKVSGAMRLSLITQFLCEACLMALFAGVISLALCYIILPAFSQLIGQSIPLNFRNTQFWILFSALTIGVGVLAGSYPALYVSSFQPIRILKGISLNISGRSTMRSSLVVFQFGFALTLIVSALVISKQIRFVQERQAGYSAKNLIHLPLSGDLEKNFQAFSNELLEKGAATSVTKSSAPITEQWSGTTEMKWKGKDPQEKSDIQRIYVDQGMSRTAGLEILQGRDMDLAKYPSDSLAVLINETSLAVMGFKNPIGEVIEDANRQWHVVGVVRDFVFTSPFQKIEPIVLFGAKMKWAFNVVYVKMNSENPVQKNLSLISEASKKFNPEYPFEYHFADQEYQRKFNNMNGTLKLTALFTFAAVFIASLGLLGLAIYMSETRMKEIGIRKVFGGSVLGITKLLSWSSIKPIIISVVVFTPLSWLAMDWWLQSFAYRVSMDWETFAIAGLSLICVALLTVSTQTIRAAKLNPIRSLRSE